MFSKVGNDLYLSRGDTGVLTVNINSSYLMTENDRVLFTIKDGNTPKIIRVIPPVVNVGAVEFTTAMTKNLECKDYKYDIRVILNAVLDQDGIPIDGVDIYTHFKPALFRLLETAGDV